MPDAYACRACGARLYREFLEPDVGAFRCRKCGALTGDAAIMASLPDQVIATYKGKNLGEAEAAWRADDARWRSGAFTAIAHAWADGPPDLATLGVVGGLFLSKDGTLSVTYQRTSVAAADASASSTITDQIRALGALRDKGLITEAEYQAKKTQLLERM